MIDSCDMKCGCCTETELPNIKDRECESIGYSYAYKTDCIGERYIKVAEVRHLLKCEYNKAIDDLSTKIILNFNDWALAEAPMYEDCKDYVIKKAIYETILQAMEGVEENAEKLKSNAKGE